MFSIIREIQLQEIIRLAKLIKIAAEKYEADFGVKDHLLSVSINDLINLLIKLFKQLSDLI